MLKEIIIKEIDAHSMIEAYIMMYFFDQVILARYVNNELIIPCEYDENLIDEIHIFNPNIEIRYTREYQEFVVVEDTNDYFDEEMYLIGNRSEIIDDKYTVVTQYGRKIVLPFICNIKNAKHDLRLVVRHLFSNEDSHICGYRLLNIIGGDRHE